MSGAERMKRHRARRKAGGGVRCVPVEDEIGLIEMLVDEGFLGNHEVEGKRANACAG